MNNACGDDAQLMSAAFFFRKLIPNVEGEKKTWQTIP